MWRIDATRDSGACIGGTDRRWATSEPAHPILAINRFGIANPFILVDELEKAATRTDHGRLWDSILPLLEGETAKSYPDPAFQTEVDLSHVSWIATANSVDPLPGPLRDRLRVLAMPAPRIQDLERLIAPVLAGIAESRWLDPRLVAALDGEEVDLVSAGLAGRLGPATQPARRGRRDGARGVEPAALITHLRGRRRETPPDNR